MNPIFSTSSTVLLGLESGQVAVFADDHRTAQFTGNQQGLVAELLGRAVRIDLKNADRGSAISARENVDQNSASPEKLTQHEHERSFAGPSDGDVSHADDGPLQSPGTQDLAVEQPVAQRDDGSVHPAGNHR